jgi:hypothetical protein
MKNQNLGSISNDVWIQGIAESFPGAYTNIATYFEPVGTKDRMDLKAGRISAPIQMR